MNQLLDARNAISRLCHPDNRNAFCFVVGAGVSVPCIPTSADMVKDWREKVGNQTSPGAEVKTALEQYEFWFTQAHLFPKERQRYLQRKIQGQRVSPANYALAKILASDHVAKLVLTTNFDMCIARALALLGTEPLVYDHPATANGRFQLEANEVQIVHVHGTYQFYDCANLKADIRSQATKMSDLVGGILKERSPIVVGYSGWEDDVIMTTLRSHLYDGKLPEKPTLEQLRLEERRCAYPVVWFCYRASELDSLPFWLKEHRDVFFVVPGCGVLTEQNPSQPSTLQDFRDSTAVSQPAEPKLPADVVFQTFLAELKISNYAVEEDPITFHIGAMEGLIAGLNKDEVVRIADFTRTLLKPWIRVSDIQMKIQQLEFVQALSLSNQFMQDQPASSLDSSIARDLIELICRAALGSGDSEEALTAWVHMIELCERLRTLGKADAVIDERWAQAWAGTGLHYLGQQQFDKAVAAFDEVLQRWQTSAGPEIEDVIASCMVNKGIAICRSRNMKAGDPAIDEILSLFSRVIEQHDNSPHPELRETVASAKVNSAYLLTKVSREKEGLIIYDRVIEQFGNCAEPAIQEHVARAMINKAFHLGERFQPGSTEDAVQLYEEITSRPWPATRPGMRTKLTLAWNGLAWQSILMAKLAILKGNSPVSTLQRAREAIQRAKTLAASDGLILGNQAYAEFLSGNKEEARRLLDEAIRVGGEKAREMELRDTTKYSVPQDPEFAQWARESGR